MPGRAGPQQADSLWFGYVEPAREKLASGYTEANKAAGVAGVLELKTALLENV